MSTITSRQELAWSKVNQSQAGIGIFVISKTNVGEGKHELHMLEVFWLTEQRELP